MTSKLNQLANDWGYNNPEDMMTDYVFDSLHPAICMNKDCDYSTEMEPDQDRGWCDCCETNTLVSAGMLMGII
tara:strand:+ start:255 stop:473 length:219 start_codon:yes stop_codon:yes gene_type:complete